MTTTRRKLTAGEIKYILDDVKAINGVDKVISQNIYRKIMKTFVSDLKSITIYPSKIDELKKLITYQYYNTQIPPGDSVGIITAQSIGERQTQLTLDTFHSTGITTGTVVTGVPRFSELLNATKKPKNVVTTIYLLEQHKTIQSIKSAVSPYLKHVTVRDVLKDYNIIDTTSRDIWYPAHFILYKDHFDIPDGYDCRVRCTCDNHVLFTHKIFIKDIATCITDAYDDIYCVWSPDIMGILDIWLNTNTIYTTTDDKLDNISPETILNIYIEDVVMQNLYDITVSGVPGITQVSYNKNLKSDVWYIEATGSNLKELLFLDIVDNVHTISNNMWEIYEVLGIEAVRQFMIDEFMNIISVDSYINVRHVELLVDVMLYTGTISSISRYGVHRNQSGPLTKCSFEESVFQFLKAGIYGEIEDITGVSSAIICGKISNVGTGLIDLVYNN